MELKELKRLMVGDWVYNTFNKKYEQVQQILESGVMLDYNDIYSADEIEPVKLTPEILKRNGFIRDGESWWYQDFRIVLSTSKGVSLVCGRQKRFAFVHELQQALRLCGIEKEIKL